MQYVNTESTSRDETHKVGRGEERLPPPPFGTGPKGMPYFHALMHNFVLPAHLPRPPSLLPSPEAMRRSRNETLKHHECKEEILNTVHTQHTQTQFILIEDEIMQLLSDGPRVQRWFMILFIAVSWYVCAIPGMNKLILSSATNSEESEWQKLLIKFR